MELVLVLVLALAAALAGDVALWVRWREAARGVHYLTLWIRRHGGELDPEPTRRPPASWGVL
jgi:hypothetical protein